MGRTNTSLIISSYKLHTMGFIMKTVYLTVLMFAVVAFQNVANGELIISQYVETNSGTTPKGIELWNSGPSVIDFSVTGLDVLKGTNGGTLSSDFTLNTGTLGVGEVMVIGTSDIGDYLDATYGVGVVQFHTEAFTFNGDDALQIQLDGTATDTFGTPGSDPGTNWNGSGVSTRNQNISLNMGITTGSAGFTDPSQRFFTVSTDPAGTGGLDGFGFTPAAVPEPTSMLLFGLAMGGFGFRRRKA